MTIFEFGNDVLHQPWRAVNEEEYKDAHKYAQRILEDLYDDRTSVIATLLKKERKPADEHSSLKTDLPSE